MRCQYISSTTGWQLIFAAVLPVLPRTLCLAWLAFSEPFAGHLSRGPCTSLEQIHFPLQVFGPESSGKTTLALHAMAAVQKQGGTALLVDAEHAFDPVYSKVCSCSVAPR